MEINSINRSDAVSKYINNVGNTSAKTSPTINISDSVELSDGAQKFSALVKTAQESLKDSGSDEEVKVNDIIARMNQHSYSVSTDDVVKGILSGVPADSYSKEE